MSIFEIEVYIKKNKWIAKRKTDQNLKKKN